MNNFKFKKGGNGFKGGYKGGFGGGSRGGFGGGDRGNDRGPVTMHSAVCSSCSKPCEVPFRPTGEKPVYCRDCFAGRSALGGERSDRRDFRSDRGRDSSKNTSQSMGNNTSFTPASSHSSNDGIKRQLDEINSKINRLINAMDALTQKNTQAPIENKKVIENVAVEKEIKAPAKIVEKMKVKKVSKKK